MKDPYELAKNILQSVTMENEPEASDGGFASIDLYGASVHGKMRTMVHIAASSLKMRAVSERLRYIMYFPALS